MSALEIEVTKFRQWAAIRLPPDLPLSARVPSMLRFYGEWECDYPDWDSLYSAFDSFLAKLDGRLLTHAEMDLLLYMLARDNEDERILETLERFPNPAVQIVEAALFYSDVDARWQAAVLAGRIRTSQAVLLLRRFLTDENEYVRQRASFAIEELGPQA